MPRILMRHPSLSPNAALVVQSSSEARHEVTLASSDYSGLSTSR